jgi:hypothetical protein
MATQVLSALLDSKDFDEYGRCSVHDCIAAEIVTSGMGYKTRPAVIVVDGNRRSGTVTFGRISSWVTVPVLATKPYPA